VVDRAPRRSDALSRAQVILSAGQPCVDLAFYRLSYEEDSFHPGYGDSFIPRRELIKAGYTFEYISPALFDLDNAVVQDGYVWGAIGEMLDKPAIWLTSDAVA
jgi:hypothetical protein